jgi:hypothetical protein
MQHAEQKSEAKLACALEAAQTTRDNEKAMFPQVKRAVRVVRIRERSSQEAIQATVHD